jgi:hypothetical protein
MSALVADAIARHVATPLTTPAATAYLHELGFPAGAQPAGITWGIDTVPADRLTASSVSDGSRAVHPGCRLMYPDGAVASMLMFSTQQGGWDYELVFHAGEWVRVDLGRKRTVVGALVQGATAGATGELGDGWHRHKFQWSADGAAWTDVDGGHVWSRAFVPERGVSAAVFGAPVVCRYLRIVAVSGSGCVQWEVVVLP